MPISSVKLVPGINTEKTPTLNEAGFTVSQLIRWVSGLVQKMGGWTKFYPFALDGIVRAMHAWLDFNENERLAVGTTVELDVITGAILEDITPQTFTTNFTPDFDTTNGSPNVVVTDTDLTGAPTTYDSVYFNTPVSVGGVILSGLYPIDLVLSPTSYRIVASSNATATVTAGGAVPEFDTTSGSAEVDVTFEDHGLSAGDTINFPIPTTVGGVTISGTNVVVSVTSADVFVISASNQASSTTSAFMNGGEVQLVYYIALGPIAGGAGYSIGNYSDGGYSTGTSFSVQTGTPIASTDWSFDNWGEILLANTQFGGIYYWQPNSGFQTARLISAAPAHVRCIFVAMPAQILVALGCDAPQNIGDDYDPLRVQWSDQLDFLNWTVSTTTQAGSFRIPTGSQIIGGFQGPQNALIWTDLDLWAMQYVGYPLVFGFNKIGSSCGLIGQHAACQLGSGIYWMGNSNFFALTSGGAVPIPCSVWDFVFQDLDTDNQHKCWAWPSSTFNEVWWFFPSASGNTGECDSYVKLNTVEGSWDFGDLPRTAGIDASVVGHPIASADNSIIYRHEDGEDADGQPINAYFETGYFAINDANEISFADWFFPDMKWGLYNGVQTASLTITFYSVEYPNDTERVYGPYTMTNATQYLNLRIRGRQVRFRVESNDVGSFWRLGLFRIRWAPDGRLH